MTAVPADGAFQSRAGLIQQSTAWSAQNAIWLWAAWLVGFATLSAFWPREMSYDILNYHVHNGWAALHGRHDIDFAPANMHSFLNPVYQTGMWWLIERLPGPAVGFILGFLHALLFPAVYWFSRNLTRAIGMGDRQMTCVVIGALGMLSEPVMNLLSSMLNDDLSATAFFVALALCLPPQPDRAHLGRFALAGFLIGAMFSIKATNAVYVVGLAVFVCVVVRGHMERIKACLVTGVAGTAGIALTGGYWFAWLWMEFGNPFFPNMNGVFGSPYATEADFPGYIRVPDTLVEGLLLPILASWDGLLLSWRPVTDLRLAALYLSCLAILAIAIRSVWRPAPNATIVPRPLLATVLAVMVLLFVWIYTFATHRYAMALWPMASLIVVCLAWLRRPDWLEGQNSVRFGLAGAALLGLTTDYATLHRVGWNSLSDPYITAVPPAGLNLDEAFVLLDGHGPVGFTAPGFPETVRIGHLPAPTRWEGVVLETYRPRMFAALDAHTGPIYVVSHLLIPLEDVAANATVETGRTLLIDDCQSMTTTIDQAGAFEDGTPAMMGVAICPLVGD